MLLLEKVKFAGKRVSGMFAFVLWAFTAILGFYEIFLGRELLFRIYARFWSGSARRGADYWTALTLGNSAMVALAIAWIALVMGGGEYHYRRVGQRCSWKLFGWTIAIEMIVLALALLI